MTTTNASAVKPMTTAITLEQFEQIDGLLTNLQRRGDLKHTIMTSDAIRGWMMHEWVLTDALVEVIGLGAFQAFASAEECAADLVCNCLSGQVEVIDAQVAA